MRLHPSRLYFAWARAGRLPGLTQEERNAWARDGARLRSVANLASRLLPLLVDAAPDARLEGLKVFETRVRRAADVDRPERHADLTAAWWALAKDAARLVDDHDHAPPALAAVELAWRRTRRDTMRGSR